MAEGDGRELVVAAQAALLDDPAFLRGLVQGALQAILEAEMDAHLGAGRYERAAGRTGYRNGDKPRTLHTRVGTLELRVPQDREGTFSTEVFGHYQRNEQALVLTLMERYVQGVSTRKVAAITEQLCGTSFSKSQVSALAGCLDVELAAWRERPLPASYPYLSVDARYEHVRVDGQVVSQGVLIVAGVRADGCREILAVEVADTESEATYQELFRRLKARGLHGVMLVTSDDHAGLRAAIARHFQGASLAALSGPLRAQCARAGRGQAPRAGGRGRAGDLRGAGGRPGARRRAHLRRALAAQSSAGGQRAGGGPRGLSRLLCSAGRAPGAGAHDQRPGTVEPGAQTPHAGGAHLPQPGGAAAAGDGLGDGAVGRVGQRAALPRHGAAAGSVVTPGDVRRRGRLTTTTTMTTVEAIYRKSRT